MCRPRFRFTVQHLAIALLYLGLVPVADALARSHTTALPVADRDYVAALATANQFLQAWQNQDQETGISLVSDQAKRHTSPDQLEQFFAQSAQAQAAFEINRGRKLARGRYSFPVTLLEVTRAMHAHTRSRSAELVVLRTGENDWAVDKLP